MSNTSLDAILPWRDAGIPWIGSAIREVRSGTAHMITLIILIPYIQDPTIPEWRKLEKDVYEEYIPRPLLRGCDTEEEILENIQSCLRSALSSGEYYQAMWILYLAEREHIYLVSERYWRQLDRAMSEIPIEGREIESHPALFAFSFISALFQAPLIWKYLKRLITEERWELVIRFFKIPISYRYAEVLPMIPTPLLSEIMERSTLGDLRDYIKEILSKRQ